MNFLHPLDIIREILTSPIAMLLYVLFAFGLGFILGKWSGQYG